MRRRRPPARPLAFGLLALLGLLLAAPPPPSAGARIVRGAAPEPPVSAPPAESGGEKVAAKDRPAGLGGCAHPLALDLAYAALAAPFALGPCLGPQGGERLARMAAADRLWIEAAQPGWRAPRLARGRPVAASRARRALVEARRRVLPQAH